MSINSLTGFIGNSPGKYARKQWITLGNNVRHMDSRRMVIPESGIRASNAIIKNTGIYELLLIIVYQILRFEMNTVQINIKKELWHIMKTTVSKYETLTLPKLLNVYCTEILLSVF